MVRRRSSSGSRYRDFSRGVIDTVGLPETMRRLREMSENVVQIIFSALISNTELMTLLPNGALSIFHYVMPTGNNGTETYGTPVKIGEEVLVDINPSFDKVSLYGDDMAVATDISMKEVEVTIETTNIPLEDQAALLGHSYSELDGLTANMTDSVPYVALMFESEKHDGGIRCVKLMKGKFAPTQETINTKGEGIEYKVPSLTRTFVADKNGVWKKIKDFAKGAATASWYTSV